MKGIFKVIEKIANIFMFNLLFILTSVLTLGIGIGASLSALCSITLDLECDDTGYYFRNYFKNFKRNFWPSTIIWLIFVALVVAGYWNILIIGMINNETTRLIIYPFVILFGVEMLFVYIYIFFVIAKFDVTSLKAIELSFWFAHKYILYSLLFVFLWICGIWLIIYVNFASVLVVFSMIIIIQSKFFKKMIKDVGE